jgi:hypothetical protein
MARPVRSSVSSVPYWDRITTKEFGNRQAVLLTVIPFDGDLLGAVTR